MVAGCIAHRAARTLVAVGICGAAWAASPAAAQTPGVRQVSASTDSIISLQTRVRYTTMVVLPDEEEILDVVCGDKDFWVISSTHNIAHIKPAKEGAATNLNLVTASGSVYSFLLNEKGGGATPDLKIYVTADPTAARAHPKVLHGGPVRGRAIGASGGADHGRD